MKHRWFAFLSVLVLAALILSSADSAADATRGRTFRRPPRGRAARLAALAGPPPNGLEPANPCLGYEPDGSPYPPGCTTAGTTSTTGTSSSSGSSSGSTSTAGSTSGSSSGDTTGSTSTAGGSTGTTSGPPSTTGNTTSTTGSTPGPNPNPNPDPGPTTGTTATTGTNGSTGTTTGSTGTTSGGWDNSGSATTVAGVSPGGYVSGTNVNAAFTLSLQNDGGSASNYTSVTINSVDITIGGSQIPNQTIGQTLTLPSAQGATVSYAERVRFASTYFQDAATLGLVATFHYTLQGPNGNQNVDCTLPTFSVVVYNKGLTSATTQDYQTPPGQYVSQPQPEQLDYRYSSQSQQGAQSADASLFGMYHSMPANGHNPGNVILGRAAILGALGTTTAYFGFTHGEKDGFLASVPGSSPNDLGGDKLLFTNAATGQSGAASEVGVATLSGRAVPLPNLVLLHACSTLLANMTDAPDAFGITTNGGQVQTDRAYGGFQGTLWSVNNQVGTTMGQHAASVYFSLQSGYTIEEAVAKANSNYQPVGDNQQPLPMIIVGDKHARLVDAYTGNDYTSSDTWYLVNPNS